VFRRAKLCSRHLEQNQSPSWTWNLEFLFRLKVSDTSSIWGSESLVVAGGGGSVVGVVFSSGGVVLEPGSGEAGLELEEAVGVETDSRSALQK